MYYTEGVEQEDDEDKEVDKFELPCPNLICEKLYIGCQLSARNKLFLKTNNISHIVNLMGGKEPFPRDFTYFSLEKFLDSPTQDLLTHIPPCITFIEKGMKEGTGVLVHCAAGVSRSCSIVVAYIMKSHGLSFEEAFSMVKASRPIVSPNCGFLKQLKMWEEMQYNLEGTSKSHKAYHLQKASKEFYGSSKMSIVIPGEDPQNIPSIDSDLTNSCKCCQRDLFLDSNVISHLKGVSDQGKLWFEEKCGYTYIEPMSWMGELCGSGGQLYCPRCKVQLGSWNWTKSQCSCGSTIQPSFRIISDKIQKGRDRGMEALTSFS